MRCMKVLDLQCAQFHLFEGWFASEDDFLSQHVRGLIECPVCASSVITKRPSAPRLNLSHARPPVQEAQAPGKSEPLATRSGTSAGTGSESDFKAEWMKVSQQIAANTDDVGAEFAEEARKIHYGEVPERAIRGQATLAETQSLIEEGIAVMPLLLPPGRKGPLQ